MFTNKITTQRAFLGCAAVAALAVAGSVTWFAEANRAQAAQMLAPMGGSSGMIAHVQESETRPTRVIVIDPAQRVMAIYEVGREKGEIKLLSSRNMTYDMQMLGYNSTDPSPEDLRKTLEKQ